jgi:hypothetical protein
MLRAARNEIIPVIRCCAREAIDETFFAADGRTSTLFVSGASPYPRRTPGDASLDYSFLGSVRFEFRATVRVRASAPHRYRVRYKLRERRLRRRRASPLKKVEARAPADASPVYAAQTVDVVKSTSLERIPFSFRGEGPAGRFFTPPSPPPPLRAPRVRRGTPSRRTAPWSSPGRARARVARRRRPSIAAWRVRRGRLRCRGP